MKIILSHGYFLEEDSAEQKIMMPYPPQGLLHLHAYLRENGIAATVFDTTFYSFNETTTYLRNEKPSLLGIYCNLLTRPNIVKIIQFIRNDSDLKAVKIILGGPDVRHNSKEYLSAGADICVKGEGEETLRELIDGAIERLDDLSKVKGIVYKNKKGEIVSTTERDHIQDLDSLPFPDFSQVPIEILVVVEDNMLIG